MGFPRDIEGKRTEYLKNRAARAKKSKEEKDRDKQRKNAIDAVTIRNELPKVIGKLVAKATENYVHDRKPEAKIVAPRKLRGIHARSFFTPCCGEGHDKLVKEIMEECNAEDWELYASHYYYLADTFHIRRRSE